MVVGAAIWSGFLQKVHAVTKGLHVWGGYPGKRGPMDSSIDWIATGNKFIPVTGNTEDFSWIKKLKLENRL